jgi:hypothetical protein
LPATIKNRSALYHFGFFDVEIRGFSSILNRMSRLAAICALFSFFSFGCLSQQQDSLALTDTVPLPPQMDFLLHDSLRPFYIVEDDSTYTFGMICADLDSLLADYPEVLHEERRGRSEFGQALRIVRLGREKPAARCVFMVGNIHAREDFSSKMVMKFLNVYLLSIAGKSDLYPRAEELLDSIDIYFMPVANPDGLKIAQEDREGIADSIAFYKDSIRLIDNYTVWKANGLGIDLNRSFDDGNFEAKKGSTNQLLPASEGYKGSFPAEPAETQFIQQFISEKRPLITASFHTKGNVLYWADAGTHDLFGGVDTKINSRVARSSGFEPASVSKDPADYGCGLENYVRACYGLIGTCVELSEGSRYRTQWPDDRFNELVWMKAWEIPYIYIESALQYSTRIRRAAAKYLH